jgi:alcohol dehydrogenase class IV
MLEPVMRFNLETARAKFAELAHVVGAGNVEDFVPWLMRLKREIGIAPSLSAVGVKPTQISALVDIAEKDICHQTNPRPCTRADFTRFFQQAM